MTGNEARRVTVTLPAALALYLDEYRQTHGLASRSEALREKEPAEEYAEYAHSGESVDLENGDGLEVGGGSDWR